MLGSEIPYKAAEDWTSLVLPVLLVAGLGVALAIGAALAARRLGGRLGLPGRARRVRVLERVALSRRAALLVVEYDGRALLVGQSGDRLSLIASDGKPPPAVASESDHAPT